MKRLILDHFRRKAWILSLGAVAEFMIGFAHARGNGEIVGSIQMQVGLFLGPFLLSLDLQRGIARPLATLPLTIREIGRCWWLATVAIPAAGYSALLFLGAGVGHLLSPQTSSDWPRLAVSGLFLLLWMGTAFSVLGNLSGGSSHPWHGKLRGLSGALWGLMIGGGYWLLRDLPHHPVRLTCFLAAGLAATLHGYFRAGRLFGGDNGFRPAASSDRRTDRENLPVHRPGGLGGLPFLVGTAVVRAVLIGLAVIVMMPLISLFEGRLHSWAEVVKTVSGMGFMPFAIVLFAVSTPTLLQLRLLRSLPISPARLAASLLLTIVLPLLTLGTLLAGIAGLALDASAAFGVAGSFLLTLIPLTLSAPWLAWRGPGRAAYGFLLVTLMVAQFGAIWLKEGSHDPRLLFGRLGSIAVIATAAAFLLTRRALVYSRHAYRPPSGPFATAWSFGR